MADDLPAVQTHAPPFYATLHPAVRQVGMLVAIAAAVAAGVWLVFWTQAPSYTLLYSGLADRDASDVVAQLDAADVPYRLDAATGGVFVPSDRKYETRMTLASAGLPRGTGFGVEEIPELGSFGQTPFMENALYTRALETELGRTIASLDPVEAARVHLALPPRSAFLRQQRQPSASVMLSLYPGRRLEQAQIQSVVNLVANAVPELAPQRVAVADQRGTPLTSNPGDGEAMLSGTQLEYTNQVETSLARRIENLLAPLVGVDRVRASVAAELDFTVNEQTRESFDPGVSVVRSEQTSQESRTGDELAQGVPGALTNQPPQTTQQAPADPAAPAPTPTTTASSQVRNFELDKTISHTKQAVGRVQRLSVGVLIDNRPPASGRGEGEPLSEQELTDLTELAKSAVGFDEARGDTISVLNAAFQPVPQAAAPAAPPLWQNATLWSVARQALGAALVLALAYFIVRPVMRSLTRPMPLAAGIGLGVDETGRAVLPRAYALPAGYDDRMAAARSVAGQDPRQVAQVVRNWVAEDNG
jgi:flagellar M-ring protein FliF